MKEMNNIKRLVLNMRCCQCAEEFEEENISPVRLENGLMIFQIKCKHCKKCFAMGFFGLSKEDFCASFEDFKTQKKAPPISYDDVLDAHKFFKNMDENWAKFKNSKI